MKSSRPQKKTGPRTEFAWLVDGGVKAYQHQRRLPSLEIVQDEISRGLAISVRTLQSWRTNRYPDRYADLRNFARLCVEAAPELGRPWIIDLFRAADMSSYADRALDEIGVGGGPAKTSLDRILDESYIRPDAVFQRVTIDDFVGREWLTAKVDAFLTDPAYKSGVFVLMGEVGVGKTTFLAHLAHQRNYLHLFGEQVPGEANVPRALRSLIAQLITRHRLEPYATGHTLPDALPGDHIAFERVLRLAASHLRSDERIVIVCDALNEVGAVPGGNVLGLPSVLPDGVYLIVSHALVPIRLNFRFAPQMVWLDPRGEDNLRDMQAYLQMIATRPDVT